MAKQAEGDPEEKPDTGTGSEPEETETPPETNPDDEKTQETTTGTEDNPDGQTDPPADENPDGNTEPGSEGGSENPGGETTQEPPENTDPPVVQDPAFLAQYRTVYPVSKSFYVTGDNLVFLDYENDKATAHQKVCEGELKTY